MNCGPRQMYQHSLSVPVLMLDGGAYFIRFSPTVNALGVLNENI